MFKYVWLITLRLIVIGEIFRARLLKVLQEQGIMTQELVDMLMAWNHNSGFNSLKCRKCGGIMRLIAFITQRSETMRILKHIGEETKRDPPLKTKLAPENPRQTLFREYIPSVEAYIGDPQYVN